MIGIIVYYVVDCSSLEITPYLPPGETINSYNLDSLLSFSQTMSPNYNPHF